METIDIPPGSAEYSEQSGMGHTISTKLNGARSWIRTSLMNTARLVNVGWLCDPTQLELLRLRSRQNVSRGGPPFLMELVLDKPVPELYAVKFMPGSFKVTNINGNTISVSAQVWAKPAPLNWPAPSTESSATYPTWP